VHWVEHIRAVVEGRATSGARKLKHQRIKASEQTFADLKPLFRAAGITRVADVTGLDALGIPTVMVARPNSRAISVAQGKGLDIWAARTSGIMEAFEGFHAERLDWPVRLLTWREFSGSVGSVDPSELPRPRRRPFDPDVRLPWIEADDLLGPQGVCAARTGPYRVRQAASARVRQFRFKLERSGERQHVLRSRASWCV